jgi:hypothetical protein
MARVMITLLAGCKELLTKSVCGYVPITKSVNMSGEVNRVQDVGQLIFQWLSKSGNRMTIRISLGVIGTCSYFGADSSTFRKDW